MAKSTPVRCCSLALLAALTCAPRAGAQASDLGRGVEAWRRNEYPAAVQTLSSVRLPALIDYTAFHLAAARLESGDAGGALRDIAGVEKSPVLSPLARRAIVLKARALTAAGRPAEAVRLIEDRYAVLPQPEGDFYLGEALEAAGNPAGAAAAYQRVYYAFTAGDAAAKSAAALLRLRDRLGSAYPAPSPEDQLNRAGLLLAARQWSAARAEYQKLAQDLSGLAREQAQIRIGAVDYKRGDARAAFRYLDGLQIRTPEAEAERLYYLAECARKLNDESRLNATLDRLEDKHRRSEWRFKALHSAGNYYLLGNDSERYVKFYRAAADDFPEHRDAPYCHWKVTFHRYLTGQSDADDRLLRHVNRYPTDVKTSTALYFLGRLAEEKKDWGGAKAYYRKLTELFPHYFYGTLARERLADARVAGAGEGEKASRFLASVKFAAPNKPEVITVSSESRTRMERARLLRAAGLDDLAEAELRFGARTDGQPHVLAMEVARQAGSAFEALRAMKSLAPDYLTMSLDDAPEAFWRYLFPMPYQDALKRHATDNGLDPYVVAGLIRQESEFNPKAVSRAKALGLTQVMPSTGRSLARRAGIRNFRASMLHQPDTSLKLGTMYLRSMLDQWGGKWEMTLASYNAGKSRADEWITWGRFREPAEFIEAIPFTETRDYVQAVLRNAAIYRQLYEGKAAYSGPVAAAPLYPKGGSGVASTKNVKSSGASRATAGKKPVAKPKPTSAARKPAAKPKPASKSGGGAQQARGKKSKPLS